LSFELPKCPGFTKDSSTGYPLQAKSLCGIVYHYHLSIGDLNGIFSCWRVCR
jgi:hypothetical protein